MNKVNFKKNELTIDEKVVTLDKNIQEIEVVNGIIIVLLTVDGSLDNVYAFDLYGDLLWKIKEPSKELIGNKRYPYVGLSFNNNKLGVVDFYGRKLYIDENNGKLIGKEIVK